MVSQCHDIVAPGLDMAAHKLVLVPRRLDMKPHEVNLVPHEVGYGSTMVGPKVTQDHVSFSLGNSLPRCAQDSKACRRTGLHFVLQRWHRAHEKFTVRCSGCICRDPGSNQGRSVLQSDVSATVPSRRLKCFGDVYSIVRFRARHVPGAAHDKELAHQSICYIAVPFVQNHWAFLFTTQDRILHIHP